jgi:uncharacterized protein YecE (DUF72 family)
MARTAIAGIGISRWRYPPWRGILYPKGLPQAAELAFAASTFGSVEISGTFYSWQRPDTFRSRASQTPAKFAFSVKGPRYITHVRRLGDSQQPLAKFWGAGLLPLGTKRSPILWRFPPNFKFDCARLESFLQILPRNTADASSLAGRQDKRVIRKPSTHGTVRRPLRHAVEIRNQSFATASFIELLRKYSIALVSADAAEWPRLMDLTSDFLDCRLQGSEELYASGYPDSAFDEWARRAVTWAHGAEAPCAERVLDRPARERSFRDLLIYFDNGVKVRARFDAMASVRRVACLPNLGPQSAGGTAAGGA